MQWILLVALLAPAAGPDQWFDNLRVPGERDLKSRDTAKIRAAKVVFGRMLEAARKEEIADYIVYAKWKIACCDFELGQYDAARDALEQLIHDQPDHGLMLLVQRELGEFYFRSQLADQAIAHFDKALELSGGGFSLRGKTYQISPVEISRIRMMRAQCLLILGRDAEALPALGEVQKEIVGLIAARREQDPAALEPAECVLADGEVCLADLEWRKGDTLAAINRQKAALKRLERFTSERATEHKFGTRLSLARAYAELTRFSDATAEIDAAEKLLAAYPGDKLRGDLEKTRAIVGVESVLCVFEIDPRTADLAARIDQVVSAANRALDFRRRVSQEKSIDRADCFQVLAKAEELRGQILDAQAVAARPREAYERAKTWADQSIAVYSKILPADHMVLLLLQRSRAWLHLKLGDVDAARQEASGALAAFADRFGRDVGPYSKEYLSFVELLLEIETRAGNTQQAAKYAAEHRRLSSDKLLSYITGLTPVEQQTFFRRWDDPGFHASLRLAAVDESLAETSAEWLLNGKAKATEVLAQINRQARTGTAFPKYQDAVERQAYFLYGPGKADLEAELLRGEKTKRDLAETRATSTQQPWRSLAALRQKLSPADAYIDIFGVNNDTDSARDYYAWIVTTDQPVQVVKLGDAETINGLVANLANGLIQYARNETGGPDLGQRAAKDEKQLRRDFLLPLSETVFQPIQKLVKGKQRWTVSPDGPLWNMPWAAMVTEENDYAVKQISFRYVISGRDFFSEGSPARQPGPPLILANPDYDLPLPAGQGHPRPAADMLHVAALAGSKLEGQEVAARLASLKPAPLQETQARATKSVLSNLDPPPRILYLSTHAFFLSGSRTRHVHDPFLCCGIMFAGSNFLPNPAVAKLPGLMTGAEVLYTALEGTELVVLSACQTGNGVTTYGHSPSSLRHAFHLAGAKAVVSSLWSVEDKSTKDLMVYFMEQVAASPTADKADALRDAQLKLISQLSQDHHTHPFFWAAFTLSGF